MNFAPVFSKIMCALCQKIRWPKRIAPCDVFLKEGDIAKPLLVEWLYDTFDYGFIYQWLCAGRVPYIGTCKGCAGKTAGRC